MSHPTIYCIRQYVLPTDTLSPTRRYYKTVFVGDLKQCFWQLAELTRRDLRTLKVKDLMDEGYRIEPLHMSFQEAEALLEAELRNLIKDSEQAA